MNTNFQIIYNSEGLITEYNGIQIKEIYVINGNYIPRFDGIIDHMNMEFLFKSRILSTLGIDTGLLKLSMNPKDVKNLLDRIGPIPEKGVSFQMGIDPPVGTQTFIGIRSIESLPSKDGNYAIVEP